MLQGKIKRFASLLACVTLAFNFGACYFCNNEEESIYGLYYAYSYDIDFTTGKLGAKYNEYEYVRLREDGTIEYWFYKGKDLLNTVISMDGYPGNYTLSDNQIHVEFNMIDACFIDGRHLCAEGSLRNGVLSLFEDEAKEYEPTIFCKEGKQPPLEELTAIFECDGKQIAIDKYASDQTHITIPTIPEKEGLYGWWEITSCNTWDMEEYTIIIEAMYCSIGYKEDDWFISPSITHEQDNETRSYEIIYTGEDSVVEIPAIYLNYEINTINFFSNYSNHEITGVVIPQGITEISRFYEPVSAIYYKGTKEEWDLIRLDSQNVHSAEKYFYVENKSELPTDGENYWHYDENGKVAIWHNEE